MTVLTDGSNTFYRMELERRTSSGSTTFSFDVNPQSFDESIDPRTTYIPTRSSGSAQNFGEGQHTITLVGNTGWSHGAGWTRAQELYKFLLGHITSTQDNIGNNEDLIFHDKTHGHSWYVELNSSLGYNQSVDSGAILHNYNIIFLVVGDASVARSNDQTDFNPGNNNTDKSNTSTKNKGVTQNGRTSDTKKSKKISGQGKKSKKKVKDKTGKQYTVPKNYLSGNSISVRKMQKEIAKMQEETAKRKRKQYKHTVNTKASSVSPYLGILDLYGLF